MFSDFSDNISLLQISLSFYLISPGSFHWPHPWFILQFASFPSPAALSSSISLWKPSPGLDFSFAWCALGHCQLSSRSRLIFLPAAHVFPPPPANAMSCYEFSHGFSSLMSVFNIWPAVPFTLSLINFNNLYFLFPDCVYHQMRTLSIRTICPPDYFLFLFFCSDLQNYQSRWNTP